MMVVKPDGINPSNGWTRVAPLTEYGAAMLCGCSRIDDLALRWFVDRGFHVYHADLTGAYAVFRHGNRWWIISNPDPKTAAPYREKRRHVEE